ncbi:MAG: 4-hydroxy-tetrahydrodipicolinate reductase [Candidatus Omnitrophica bacterium]|nr:4-hydroxy-tetrahydrodipicolinate reductase [Candidatus Omnitrophota bacterium]MCF7894189.1 4-hydroxy-tetrahydrodipicolinate reductase [Candidatus Omnitrophota bacterium]
MVNLAINGICGKMGQRILRLAEKDDEIKMIVGFEQEGHPELGKEIDGIKVSSDYTLLEQCDSVIDFSAPAGTIATLEKTKEAKKSIVIGTTNLDKEQEAEIESVSKDIPVVYSPNMSIGVNLFFKILKTAASVLREYQVSIKEAHHIHKKDAPSGTAKKLAEIINKFGFNLDYNQIESKREGEIIGDHQVTFESELDSFEIIHHAKTRDIFAQGAIIAAKWIKQKPAGLYSMEDILFD